MNSSSNCSESFMLPSTRFLGVFSSLIFQRCVLPFDSVFFLLIRFFLFINPSVQCFLSLPAFVDIKSIHLS